MKTDGNEPINPTEVRYPKGQFRDSQTYKVTGLSKREYFAAMALQGILATNPQQEIGDRGRMAIADEDWIAYRAIACADALIRELNKERV